MPDAAPNQIHLVLSSAELATIVIALRAIELHGFAERLDTMSRQPPEN